MRQRAIANTTSLAKLKTGFAAFGKFMLSPLGLIGIFLLLVVIFKKVRDATDTTNVTVAKLKIVFDKIAKAVQDLWQKIKNLLIPVLEGLKNAAEFLGIGAGGLLVGLFDLSPIEEAAAEFRVLSNEIKTLNAEIKDLQKENDKLNKTLEEYSKLATIGFKSTQQIASMAEAERSLQNILSEARGYQVTLTGAELIDEAARLFDEQTQAIIANQQEQTDSINAYFKKYPINFSQALEDESFADMVGDVKKVAQTYGISLIQKFEDMEPEVQEALRRMISFDPIGFLDSANKVIQIAENTGLELTRRMMSYSTDRSIQFTNVSAGFTAREGETPEEAFARAQAEIPELQTTYEEFLAMLDGSLQAAETTASNLYQTVLPAVATEMTRILDPKQADDFAEGIMALQNMDLSKLTTDELDLLQRTYPSLAQILDLPGTAEQLQAIADAGGASFLRSFGAVQETIAGFASSLGGRSRSQNNKLATQLSSSLIDILTSDDLASSVDAAMNDVFRGAVGGVIIPEGERIGLANELLDMIPKMDDEALRVATFSFAEDMQNLAEIANKSRADMTEKDLELLSKYPQALRDIEKGTFNINQLREEESQRILENLQAEEDGLLTRHNTAKRVLLEELKSGEKTVEQYERALQIENDEYAASLATLNILRDKITAQDSLTKEQEDQYKVQLDALKAQKDSIAKAKELQKLQQDSADIARRSLEATRIGAVGTIEAQFNQQQLNQEIAQMNKDLQDRIMLAQIEAQQKILEDSQQKAIEAATVDNTNATIENTVAERELNETLKTIATNPTALVSRPNVLDRFDSAADQSNAFLAIQE